MKAKHDPHAEEGVSHDFHCTHDPCRCRNRDPYPRVARTRCPACNHESLFLGSGGYLTCSNLDCPEPVFDDALTNKVGSLKESYELKVKDFAAETAKVSELVRLVAIQFVRLHNRGCRAHAWSKECGDCKWMQKVEESRKRIKFRFEDGDE